MNNVEQNKYIVGDEIDTCEWYFDPEDGRMHLTHYCNDCALEVHVTKSAGLQQASIGELEIKHGLQRLMDMGCGHITVEIDKKQSVDPNVFSDGMDSNKGGGSSRGKSHARAAGGKRK